MNPVVHDGQTWVVPFYVNEIVDGDSIGGDADVGYGIWKRNVPGRKPVFRVRIQGLKCPERNTLAGQLARAWAADLLPVGTRMTLVSRWLVSFERVIGSLYLYPDGEDYAALCAAAGHGELR